jgi:hypothetical protein
MLQAQRSMRRMWDEIHTLHYDLFDEAAADPEARATRQGRPAATGAAAEAVTPVHQVNLLTQLPRSLCLRSVVASAQWVEPCILKVLMMLCQAAHVRFHIDLQGAEAGRAALAELLTVPDLTGLGISSTTADLLTVLTLLDAINR